MKRHYITTTHNALLLSTFGSSVFILLYFTVVILFWQYNLVLSLVQAQECMVWFCFGQEVEYCLIARHLAIKVYWYIQSLQSVSGKTQWAQQLSLIPCLEIVTGKANENDTKHTPLPENLVSTRNFPVEHIFK